jgi:Holliday junction resolvase hjc
MSHYNAGRTFEWKVRDALREDGYEVLRSAGSKTKIDLVAVKPGQLVFVQCKVNGLCAPAERSKLRDLAGMVDALPVVAYSHKEGRSAAVVRYRLLTGDGPKAFASWTPDIVAGELELLGQADVPARRLSARLDSGSPGRVGSSDPAPCHFEAR